MVREIPEPPSHRVASVDAIAAPLQTKQRPRSREQRLATRMQLIGSASVAYAILALLSGLSGSKETPITEIWLPAGLADALALRVGFWALPVPILGCLLSHLAAGDSFSAPVVWIALGHACGLALLVLVAPRWMRGLDLFASLGNLLGFLGAAALAAALSTTIAAVGSPNLRDWSQQGDALGWWGGDLSGAIVLAPALLSWLGRSAAPRLRELRRPEFVLLLLSCLLAALISSQGVIRLLALRPQAVVVPLMIWSGLRFSPAAATLANTLLVLTLAELPDQSSALLPLSRGIESQELLELGISTSLLVSLVVLVVSNNRSRASRQLAQLAGSQERTIAERTAELAAANAQLRHLSETDGLTGLVNRRHFDTVLRERWCAAAAAGTSLAVALIDIDHFKQYNDHYGHPAGDRCLQQVAAVLAAQRRQGSDCAARYGGEEFVLLWSDVDTDQAALLAERLRQGVWALQLAHASSPVSAWVSLSIGVAATHPDATTARSTGAGMQLQIEQLLQQADQRLYSAKQLGRNRVVAG